MLFRSPWLKPLSFQPAAGWYVGASGTVHAGRSSGTAGPHYPQSTAWTANVRYRDPATAGPPKPTIDNLGRSGIVVSAVIEPPAGTTKALNLDLRNARPFPCCNGTPSHTHAFELIGLKGSRRYETIVRVYFGTTPTARLWAVAQEALRRIQLPRSR